MSLSSRLAFFSKIFQRSAELETYVQKAWGHRIHPGGTTFYVTTTYSNGVTDYYVSAPNGEREIWAALNAADIGTQFPVYQYVSGTHLENPCSGELQNTIVKKLDVKFTLTAKHEGMPSTFEGTISGVQGTLTLHPSTWSSSYVYGLHREVVIDGAPILGPDNHHPFEERVPYTTEEYEKQIALAAKNSAELTDVNIQARVNKVKSGDTTGESNWFVDTVWDNVDLVMKGLVLDGMRGTGDDINGPFGAYCTTPTEITTISGLSSLYASLEGVDGQGNHFIVRDKFVKNLYDQFISEGVIASSISPSGDQTHYTFFVANPHTLTFSAEGPGKAQAFIDDGDPGTEFFSPATMKFGTESYFELTPDTGKYYDFCEQIVSGYEPYVDYSNPDAWPVFTFNMDIGFKFHFSDTQFDIEKTNLTFTGEFSAGSALTVDVTGIATEQFQHGFRMHITGHDTATPPVSIDLVTGLTYANYEGEESCSGDVVIDGVYYEVHLYPSETEGHYTLSVYRVEE